MNKDWILQKNETRLYFSNATWIPLRALINTKQGDEKKIGFVSEFFGCGSVAFPPEHKEIAERLSWNSIGISCTAKPYAYKDGYYSSIEQYEYDDKEPIGIHLVLDHPQPIIGGNLWMLNPDLIVALRLIKEGNNWVRPEENFVEVIQEKFDDKGKQTCIQIKREFLIDYLAARNLSLRLSYYRQRIENVASLENSAYANLDNYHEQRDNGRFELGINSLNYIFGGKFISFRVWRTDIDKDEDAPVMGEVNNDNTDYEKSVGYYSGYGGMRIEGEFWRDEWINHQGQSKRVRGDIDIDLPRFIVKTDGTRMASFDLKNENIGVWLWFSSSIVNELLNFRGFSLQWYTAETGGIRSASGTHVHFGLNAADLITVYAYDIACLSSWEQYIWAAHNVVPNGKVSNELFLAQVKAQVASTDAAEDLLYKSMTLLEDGFRQEFAVSLFSHEIDYPLATKNISRFISKDQASLLKLAKELIRVFSDRLNIRELRNLSTHLNKDKFGSNKLLQDILSQKVGEEKAHMVFGPIIGVYDMRVGDAHPTSSKITHALELANIDKSKSYLRQGEQLILNFGKSISIISKLLFEKQK